MFLNEYLIEGRRFGAVAFAAADGEEDEPRCLVGNQLVPYQSLFNHAIRITDNIHFNACFSANGLDQIMVHEENGENRLKYISGYRKHIGLEKFQMRYINGGCPGKRFPKCQAGNFICYNRSQLH